MNTLIIYSLLTPVGFLIKITLLLLAAWAACLLLRRASAATRHLVWAVALVGVMFLPLLSLALPRWEVAWKSAGVPASMSSVVLLLETPAASSDENHGINGTLAASDPEQSDPKQSDSKQAALSDVPLLTPPASVPSASKSNASSVPVICTAAGMGVWSIGFLLIAGQFLVGLRRIKRIETQASSLGGSAAAAAERTRQSLGVRPVAFLQAKEGSGVAVPVTWGFLRPVVLLPAQSKAWSEDCLRAALLHELAHVQRGDWPTQLMARTVCALYWWHPLVWWAARQAREESERASDDLVLGTGMKAADYARRLVEVVRSMPAGAPARTVAVALARPSEVEGRVQAVLAMGKNRSYLSPKRLTLALMMFSFLLLPLSTLRPVLLAASSQTSMNPGVTPFQGHPVVVVDAGHGGIDTGGIGLNKIMEKDLTLAIAQQLCMELEQRGAVVYMTRGDDTFSSIEDRSHLAAVRHADYFISVHCDLKSAALQNSHAGEQGTQVFFHGNDAKCHRLAQDISQQVGRTSGLSPNRVLSDISRFVRGFGVLREASMPAVLVECGYLDNAHDLKRLRDPQGQQQIADGIVQGLITFQVQN